MNTHATPEYKPEFFGAGHDTRFPTPVELLHVSVAHTGPGIEDLVRFYQIVLNMRVVFRVRYPAAEFIALSHDDENHRIGILNNLTGSETVLAATDRIDGPVELAGEEPRHVPLRQCRIEHGSWRYARFEDVVITAKRVHDELGIWPLSSRLAGYDITIDYTDPDGNRVELLSQSKSKAQILHELDLQYNQPMNEAKYTDVYQVFNMEKLVTLFDAGESIENLRNKTWVKDRVAEGLL
jgi:hypothetical protein